MTVRLWQMTRISNSFSCDTFFLEDNSDRMFTAGDIAEGEMI
ncbi:MAG: hypothetical protein AABX98_03145 [Nanoarchaeota archaeon]